MAKKKKESKRKFTPYRLLDVSFKRGKTGMYYEHQDRYFEYMGIKNEGRVKFYSPLMDVLTFKEAEIIFKLPRNTIVQDYKSGHISPGKVRKSANTYLIPLKYAQQIYEDYWQTRARKNISHLYSGYDGKKMSEAEYFIRFGDINVKTRDDFVYGSPHDYPD